MGIDACIDIEGDSVIMFNFKRSSKTKNSPVVDKKQSNTHSVVNNQARLHSNAQSNPSSIKS